MDSKRKKLKILIMTFSSLAEIGLMDAKFISFPYL